MISGKKIGEQVTPPGYYKVNYNALSVSRMFHAWGLLRLPLRYLIFRFKKPTPAGWMPTYWKDLECAKTDLSDQFWRATTQYQKEFELLGFSQLGMKKVKHLLNPIHRDSGGITYLDASRCHFGQLIYARVHTPPPIDTDRENVTIAFTAVFAQRILTYTNSQHLFECPPEHEVVMRPSYNVTSLYQSLTDHLARLTEKPIKFSDDESLHRWFDSNQLETLNYRVRKGLFTRMSDAEVEAARRKLPPALPGGSNVG